MRPMVLMMLMMLFLLAGCQKDFEQRYSDIETEVKKDAARIDADMRKDAEDSKK